MPCLLLLQHRWPFTFSRHLQRPARTPAPAVTREHVAAAGIGYLTAKVTSAGVLNENSVVD